MPPLRLGLELVAAEPVRLHLGSFFESWLALSAGAIKRSLGRDDYHLDISVGPGRRLAATGRTYICQIDAEEIGLGINQARAAVMVSADLAPGTPLMLGLRTNVFLDLAAMRASARLRVQYDSHPVIECGFGHSCLGPEQLAPGRYLVDLTGLLQE